MGLTFGELLRRVVRVAAALSRHDFVAGDRLARGGSFIREYSVLTSEHRSVSY